MRKTRSNKNILLMAFVGGVVAVFLFKLYVFTTDKKQSEDSNLLVGVVMLLLATAIIYVVLKVITNRKSS
jgi:NADH:ubiquinone oxidoreductase subunit 6 (subunit J)